MFVWRYSPILFVLLVSVPLAGCGESEEDKASREELTRYVRRVNLFYKTLDDARENERTLSRGGYGDYFDEYTTTINRLREDLYAGSTTDRFDPVRVRLDSIITLTNQFNAKRKSLMGDLFTKASASDTYDRRMAAADNYSTARYALEALEEARDALNEEYAALSRASDEFYDIRDVRRDLLRLSDTTNVILRELDFQDTLSYAPIVLDEEDVLKEVYASYMDPGEFVRYPVEEDSTRIDTSGVKPVEEAEAVAVTEE